MILLEFNKSQKILCYELGTETSFHVVQRNGQICAYIVLYTFFSQMKPLSVSGAFMAYIYSEQSLNTLFKKAFTRNKPTVHHPKTNL